MAKKQEGAKAPKFEIYVPGPGSYFVQVNGQEATNWRELHEEARVAVEPLVRERWLNYWKKAVNTALAAHQASDLRDIMKAAPPPSMYYPCPAELASKVKMEDR